MLQPMQSIGIDVSKSKLDVCFSSNCTYQFSKFNNDAESISCLITQLPPNVPIVIESTADYHILLSCMLYEANLNVFVINPIITKKLINSTVRGSKSDKNDAKLLSNIGITYLSELKSFNMDRSSILLKKKMKLLTKLINTTTSLNRSFKGYQDLSSQLDKGYDPDIENIADKLKDIRKLVKKKEQEILADYNSDISKEISKLRGVSEIGAKKLSLHLEGKVFEKANQVVAFAGLDVRRKQSGSSIHSKGHISKRGSSHLRDLLFKLAWGLKMNNHKFREIYERHRKRGKHYYTCLIILSKKLLRIVFGLIKNRGQLDESLI